MTGRSPSDGFGAGRSLDLRRLASCHSSGEAREKLSGRAQPSKAETQHRNVFPAPSPLRCRLTYSAAYVPTAIDVGRHAPV